MGQLAPARCPVRELTNAQVHRAVGTKVAQEREVGLGVSGHRPSEGPSLCKRRDLASETVN